MDNPLQRVLQTAKSRFGSKRKFAQKLGISPQAVDDWSKLDRVPHERVLTVAKLLDLKPHQVRPDLYPRSMKYDAAS